MLGLLLAGEVSTHEQLRVAHQGKGRLRHLGDSDHFDLKGLRIEHEQRRRADIIEQREHVDGKGKRIRDEEGWSTDEEALLRKEAEDVWPEWWGCSAILGTSPFDYVPLNLQGERKRVLFLTGRCRSLLSAYGTDYTDYLERMNTHTYEIVDGASFNHCPELIVSGSWPSSCNGRRMGSWLGGMEHLDSPVGKRSPSSVAITSD